MKEEETTNFDEPKSYGVSKYRLMYSVCIVILIVGSMIFVESPTPPICFGLVAVFAIYLFLPFTYRLIVSDEAISSINLLGVRTLEWNVIVEIEFIRGHLFLSDQNGGTKVTVNQQIDNYPVVIKYIQQQRPELWDFNYTNSFHQEYSESVFAFLMGLGAFVAGIVILFNGLASDMVIPILFLFGLSIIFVLTGLLRIRKLSLDGEILFVHYLFGKRQLHVKDVWSVSLEPKFGKNILLYEVRIRVKDKKDIVVENIKEGNPVLVSAIETWMKNYKGTTK